MRCPAFASFLTLYLLGVVVATIVHEGGHLAMGLLTRCDPRVVCIGSRGPTVVRFRLAGVWIAFRLLPIGGYVLLPPRSRDRRSASFLVTSEGPLANLLALLALLAVAGDVPVVFEFAWVPAQALILILSLIPHMVKMNGLRVSSDGREKLAFLRGRDHDVLDYVFDAVVRWSKPQGEIPRMTPAFAEVILHAARIDRLESWGKRQAIDGLGGVIVGGRLNARGPVCDQDHLRLRRRRAGGVPQRQAGPITCRPVVEADLTKVADRPRRLGRGGRLVSCRRRPVVGDLATLLRQRRGGLDRRERAVGGARAPLNLALQAVLHVFV